MRVARAEEAHVPLIVERWKELMDLHRDIDPAFTRDPEGQSEFGRYIQGCLTSEDYLVLVALEGEDVLGYLLAHVSKRPPVCEEKVFGEVSELAVRKEHQRKGIGDRMFKGTLKWFKSKGVGRVEVRVSPKNLDAMGFWKEHGFEEYYYVMHHRL